jgi:hypothetical protein
MVIARIVSAVIGACLLIEICLVAIVLAVVVTPVSLALSIAIGVPVYMIAASGSKPQAAMNLINALAWGPIRWASGVIDNAADRFATIVTGEPSVTRLNTLGAVDRQRRGYGGYKSDYDKKMVREERNTTQLVAAILLVDIVIIIIMSARGWHI